jgi:hypothetical protein
LLSEKTTAAGGLQQMAITVSAGKSVAESLSFFNPAGKEPASEKDIYFKLPPEEWDLKIRAFVDDYRQVFSLMRFTVGDSPLNCTPSWLLLSKSRDIPTSSAPGGNYNRFVVFVSRFRSCSGHSSSD